jgi:hypothetical protein
MQVNDQKLAARDGARIVGGGSEGAPAPLTITAGSSGAHFLMVEMARSD